MKRLTIAALTACCMAAGTAAAQQVPDKAHTETTLKQTGPDGKVRTKSETVVGTVKDYEAGKKIKLSGPADKTYSFDLDEGAQVQGSIVVGQPAKVTFYKGNDGAEHVSVISEASASSQMAASAPRVHSESTMKKSAPGMDTIKTKSEVVIGVVKDYEPGRKIRIAGPKNKDYSFDLDEQVAMKGAISVGERVKVTCTKADDGQKVTTVESYNKS